MKLSTKSANRKENQTLLRSEEHTSELQSPCNLVCRLLLEKKKKKSNIRLLFSLIFPKLRVLYTTLRSHFAPQDIHIASSIFIASASVSIFFLRPRRLVTTS